MQKTLKTINKYKGIAGIVVAIVITLLNGWYIIKSIPLLLDLQSVQANASSNTKRIDTLEKTSKDTNDKVTENGKGIVKLTCFLLKEDCLR